MRLCGNLVVRQPDICLISVASQMAENDRAQWHVPGEKARLGSPGDLGIIDNVVSSTDKTNRNMTKTNASQPDLQR